MATLIRSDLEFILQQIRIAEQHAAGADLASLLPNNFAMLGLRTVDGSFNNLVPGQQFFGAADQVFPNLVSPSFRPPYSASGNVIDPEPRTISNLIVDQTITNPSAVQAFIDAGFGILVGSVLHFLNADGTTGGAVPAGVPLTIPNTAPDEGLSAGFNSWFVFFGQFFDHGLDFIQRTTERVIIPLAPDDPIFIEHPTAPPFMVIERTLKDGDGNATNRTTPFVDQNQTYTSHASHQVFLREYVLNGAGIPVATGRLIQGQDGGMATWADVKAQARNLLGIELTDQDVGRVPLLVTDAYGNFIPGANGLPQLIVAAGPPPVLLPASLTTPVAASAAVASGHAFIIDIAHNANPTGKVADANTSVDPIDVPLAAGQYDDELLNAHFMAGDGRANENIALTAVHHIFHSEHNRQIDEIKATLVAAAAADAAGLAFLNEWLLVDVAAPPASPAGLAWDGERLFQAAKFATEMQYQHLVFEEFARRVQPNVDEFLQYDATINPAILAEFAHTVYRFGHSMLTETVDRFDPNFVSSEIGLIEAFLNPLAFNAAGTISAADAAGAIVRGTTRQLGNEIDEFVTEALRNNLLGLPLDLATINLARGRETGVPTLNEARREFFRGTGDTQLTPYVSWADFAAHLKHPESLINFIAAYGTHAELLAADVNTLAEKRGVATALTLGGSFTINAGGVGGAERVFTADATDRIAFLNSTGAYASLANGVTTTGVDDIDLWVGGLAERQMPFGGLLGSTFNFVFETQLEALQNGDRFYYLGRLAGLNFLTEMENNSFAKLIMANTNATHLPADVFSTPTWILEVNPSRQFNDTNGDGVLDSLDPTGGTALTPLVIRDNPDTSALDSNYLRYTGADHVVLGGTNPGDAANPSGDDILIASEGDDTVWGDGGNDRIEGGDGNDILSGGAGHDIITDRGGDDTIRGDAGNDVIHGGNGLNLLIGGDGKDFIITGEDVSDTFGGQGDDFILGAKSNLPSLGNEGHDWIEIGTQDGAPGDNFDLLNRDTVDGHDVFIGGGGFDEMLGEGGGDIFVGSEGEDHFDGGSGFDWTTYKNDTRGVSVDLLVSDFVEPPATPSNAGILDRFAFVEGLSGSAHADVLRGDNQQAADFPLAGARGSALDQQDIDFIAGLRELLGTGVTSFASGNIILGGSGSDIIEGRAGNDIIDGDRYLNVRISVRAGIDANGNAVGAEIASADGMASLIASANPALSGKTLVQLMLAGTLNPGQLVIQREILTGTDSFDTAVYSAPLANYTIDTAADGTTTVTDNRVAGGVGVPITDGTDILRGIERLQFADQAVVLPGNAGLNAAPVGQLAISDDTPSVNQLITVSNAAVTDANGIAAGSFTYLWQVERNPGTGVFQDIVLDVGGSPSIAHGTSFRVTANLDGLALRVRAVYKDGNGTLENVYSAATAPVAGVIAVAPVAPPPAESPTVSAGNGVHFIRSDLQFILDQIKISEANSDAYGQAARPLTALLDNSRNAFGLRTVDGSFNNLIPGQQGFGASDQNFPSQIDQVFRNDRDGDTFGPVTNTNYASTISVADADPRIISNLIVDQTAGNPAAVAANGGVAPVTSPGLDGVFGTADDRLVFHIDNATPDAALSAPFNAWFVFFGQFFDHGLDLVDKGGNGTVFMPLQPDDPLIAGADGVFNTPDDLPPGQRFLVLTRATNTSVTPGADGVLGTADDVHTHNNETTPFVDQNQTYTSHSSHQVFLREYALDAAGRPVSTGRLIDGVSGIANWAEVKAQAASMLGIALSDFDVHDVPLLRADAYGKFIPDPATGFAQVIVGVGADGIANTADDIVVVGSPGSPISPTAVGALRTGHAFLNDIAHHAAPGMFDTNGPAPGGLVPQTPDLDAGPEGLFGDDLNPATYDDELLAAHVVTGDGRGNENIALTAVHHVFHSEHNRMAEHIKDVAIASNDAAFANEWLLTPITQLQLDAINAITDPAAKALAIDALNWDGERIFQAARFGTEMQYQHLVFEEFARKVQPQVDIFFAPTQVYDTAINPAIVAEFAHVVYRFGHSMLTETVDRFDPSFNVISNPNGLDPAGQQTGLIAAFLNPLAFTQNGMTAEEAAGAIVRGTTRQAANEIDEFVTEALRNNLLGLPLDLPAINLARGRDTGVPPLNQARAEFFAMTGDSQLTPYRSWADFSANIKHPESLINFIAAYGTHSAITGALTTADKRAAAYAIVYGEGGLDGDPLTLADNPTVPVPADRIAFLTSTGAWASNLPADPLRPKDVDGVSTTGLGNVDLWIGGLAEKQMPFGGLLGSTFNFVFETQLEKLQDGDRFYYLERTQGMNFLTELENNSFAKLIMANTDATHLPGDVFSTPAFILEANAAAQFTGLGPTGRDDPLDEGGNALVIRNNPNTPTPDPNYLRYTGVDHVVLGGTAGQDTLIGSIGDDTLYGDGDRDRLEGGDGVDTIFGGDGDDIITDKGGDDLIQGQDGNDAIHGGNGINLILGGFGKDFIVTGEDASESFGGFGNDFILGVRANEFVFGNEGDDWIEVGMVDGAAGDNFDAFGRDNVRGNDVFIGEGLTDRMDGEGGDDIMVGNGGDGDRYEGFSGFDWAVFKDAPTGATADLTLRAFDETPLPPNQAVLARFTSVEGLSGSAHGDFLRGDNNTATEIAVSGAYGSVLENIGLINGLQEFLNDLTPGPANVTSFGAGNIILGGAGSDLIEGRGGDDLIDGDLWLNVRVGLDQNANGIIDAGELSADSLKALQAQVFSGQINPGDLHIVREILNASVTHAGAPNFDTAIFSGALLDAAGNANYTIAVNGIEQDVTVPFTINAGDIVTVSDLRALDGTDTLRNIERLQFTDQALVINGNNLGPVGLLAIDDATPTENQILTVSIAGVTDPNNPNGGAITGPVTYFWQQEVRDGVFEDIVRINEAPEAARAIGPVFTPNDFQVGAALRVRAVYKDANGVLETVYSAPTALVAGVNDAPTGVPTISDATPTETEALTASAAAIIDPDGTTTSVFAFEWQQANATGVGGGAAGFTTIAAGPLFTPAQAQVNRELRMRVTYTDDQGFLNEVFSVPTTVVGEFFAANGAAQILNGNAGQDLIFGGGGGDVLNGNAGADRLDGGAGADQIDAGDGSDRITGGAGGDLLNGGLGSDVFSYVFGDGSDTVNGGGGDDTLIIDGTAAANTLNVTWNGTALTNFEGGSLTSIETVTADLLGGTDTLSYAASAAAVQVNLGLGTASGFSASPVIPADGTIPQIAARPAIAGIENVTGGTGADTLTGDANANVLRGGGGADVITGGAGNDTLNGNAANDLFLATIGDGNDSYAGGAGTDTYNLSATTAGATIAAGLAGPTSATSAQTGTDTLDGIESLVGSQGIDRVNITAAAGAQTLNVVFNGTSITSFEAVSVSGIEEFTANLGAGIDTLSFAGSAAGVAVDLTAGTASGGFVQLAGIENVTGTAQADTLVGVAGLVNALTGGAGNDTYVVHDAGDTVVEANGVAGGVDLVRANVTYTISDVDVENLTLLGTANIDATGNGSANVIIGNTGNNILIGLAGADTLDGGGGNDTLIGGTGLDDLIGGLGDDTFDFNALNESGIGAGNNDDILDFQGAGVAGGDIIDLATLDANAVIVGNQAFSFIGTAAFSAAGQLRALQVGADTILQANTNANTGTIELEIRLVGITASSLVAGDFVL